RRGVVDGDDADIVASEPFGQTSHEVAILFFFHDTPTTEIYTLSLHDALPIYLRVLAQLPDRGGRLARPRRVRPGQQLGGLRSEEHTSELQSRQYLVCRLL